MFAEDLPGIGILYDVVLHFKHGTLGQGRFGDNDACG